ncbi:hypothetical protein [uncultured Clostridium sp.]|uniref:hypothetical protein n=1 Tax=uncultured Clostridium sp. TaxID=59620 RepID=UPI002637CB00|nr:hypothetical protein [uncultured Clostridium sp.]
MFNKIHKKHIFQRINGFYNRLEYIYTCVETKYPILDNDTSEQDLILENLTNLMKKFEKDICSYKDNTLTFSDLEYELEKHIETFDLLKSDFPVLACFLVNPPFVTGDSVFPLTDILNYSSTLPKY